MLACPPYGNHRVIVFDAKTGAFKRMWGAFGEAPVDDDHCDVVTPDSVEDPGPRQFSTVHSIRVSNDGVVYVVDRENQRVQTFTLDGRYLRQVVRLEGQPSSLALSRDTVQRFLYVDERGGGTLVYDRKTLKLLTIVTDVEGAEGLGHLMDTDS